jgi:hypothetical protein
VQGNYETGNQAFSMHLRFLTIRHHDFPNFAFFLMLAVFIGWIVWYLCQAEVKSAFIARVAAEGAECDQRAANVESQRVPDNLKRSQNEPDEKLGRPWGVTVISVLHFMLAAFWLVTASLATESKNDLAAVFVALGAFYVCVGVAVPTENCVRGSQRASLWHADRRSHR